MAWPGAGRAQHDWHWRGLRQRRLHKAFLRYHDAENWPLLREALKEAGVHRTLPFKHVMWIDENGIHVREGYGNEERYLVETKRGVILRAVTAKHDETSPFRIYADGAVPDPVYKAWSRQGTLLADVMRAAEPTPPGDFDGIVERVWSFLIGTTPEPPWPFTPRAKD